MLMKFIAIIALALGTAGVVILINRLFGRRLPKWVMPVAIGTAVIGFNVYDEYSWHSRIIAGLENTDVSYEILAERQVRAVWRPWSYIYAPTGEVDILLNSSLGPYEENPEIQQGIIKRYRQNGMETFLEFLADCQQETYYLTSESSEEIYQVQMEMRMKEVVCA